MGAQNKHTDILKESTLKKNPFSVPDGYFMQVQSSVMSKISASQEPEQQKQKANNIFNIIRPAIAMAACFALIFGLGYGVMHITDTADYKNPNSAITAENTSSEVSTDIDVIIAFIGNMGTESIAHADTAKIKEPENNLSKSQVEQYLINSGISTTTLASLE